MHADVSPALVEVAPGEKCSLKVRVTNSTATIDAYRVSLFGLDPAWGMLTVPFIGWISGYGWACFGISVAGYAKSIENFNYIVSAVLTPLFLLAGSFFPLDNFPEWAQVLAQFNPLHQTVVLVRHAVFGYEGWEDVARVGMLVVFGLIVWRVAIHAMVRKLID